MKEDCYQFVFDIIAVSTVFVTVIIILLLLKITGLNALLLFFSVLAVLILSGIILYLLHNRSSKNEDYRI